MLGFSNCSQIYICFHSQYGDDDYDMGDDYDDDFTKELIQYRKCKDRGRGEFKTVHHPI